MPSDLPAGPDSPPVDQLSSAESSLGVLQHVVHVIAADDLGNQTPCTEFDVAALTDHLLRSIAVIGGAAGAELPERNPEDSVERQLILAARPALDAWHRRGLEGTLSIGPLEDVPAAVVAGIFSIEFLIHAWDYGQAIGRPVEPADSLSEYVFGLARTIITPQARGGAGFDDPVDVPEQAPVFERLLAFSGRRPRG